MERSSKFLSLSGLSGVLAGVFALLGAAVAWLYVLERGHVSFGELLHLLGDPSYAGIGVILVLDAILVLVFAVLGAVYLSYRKAMRAGKKLWTGPTRHLLFHLVVPLIAGGIFIIILVLRSDYGLVAPVMLIFYGLSLVNAGKFTFGEIQSLGLIQIVLGLMAAIFIQQGLLLWTIGFGVVHIVYGTMMYYRHDRA
jgi:hypothetical protein